ncbi:efflux RND transporter periplasmic adaptor subunit [Sinisalibacter aestuarii]|uniref:Multidrug resistance protein MdtA-like C-terminal permuted SH3 domain-containing protein n=1 Tax=Sinisalibacter aestuarii TaxID=2949426 RepID=A0ABQ5LVU4_9RHOB|nr:hypothetical protein [Sinisalibacter aestuarii]GKY89119.1 hypothetical protein STA1M1_29880 [Sinisalibacter aestuarii]
MRNGLKLVLVTLPLIAAGAGYLAYTIQTKAPPAQIAREERRAAVRVVTAREGALSPVLIGYGLVTPASSFDAIAQVGGQVAWVNPALQRGAILPAGAVLLRIADEDYALAVAQSEANIRAAEAKLTELVVSEDNQRAALDIEMQTLALKAAELDRAERLNASGALPEAGLDAARAAHLAQRQKVQSIESALALLPVQRAVQDEQIAVSRAALETARLNLARTEITLPFEARVASVSVEVGRYLRAGEVAAVLDETETAEIEAQVPVARLRELLRLSGPEAGAYAADPTTMTDVLQGLGLSAEVRLAMDDGPLVWPARVARVSDTIDIQTGTLGVIVEVSGAYSGAVPAEQPPLTKGMFVEVAITGRPVAGFVVPRAALDGDRLHLVGDGERLEERRVTPLLVQNDLAVIGAGLEAGTRVVVSDIPMAIPGALLDPVEDAALTARIGAVK